MPRRAGHHWRLDRAHFLATTDETHCYLAAWCGGAYVDRTLPGTHPLGPTVHHEHELMRGGPELVRDGAVLHLAHNRCNAAEGNRVRAQLIRAGRSTRPNTATSREW